MRLTESDSSSYMYHSYSQFRIRVFLVAWSLESVTDCLSKT